MKCCRARLRSRPRHMIASSSPSARKPIDTTFSCPEPTGLVTGIIDHASVVPSASMRPSRPSMRGTEKPQMSASSNPTVRPRAARAAARFTVTDDLPTPPLPDATATTRALGGISVSVGRSRAFHLARDITRLRSSAVISAMRTRTETTPGSPPTRASTSLRSWVRRGQPAMVRASSTSTSPPALTWAPRTMPRSTTLSPSSGSMTPRRPEATVSSPAPLATSDIAEVLDLHPNTVRPHLERLREAGLLEVESASQGSVGRPQHRYMLTDGAPSLGLEPPAYPLLADLLAQLAAELGARDDDVAEVGRTWGRHEAETLEEADGEVEDAGAREESPCVDALVAELAEL